MHTFGTIRLKSGPTGEKSEAPLEFDVASVNLIVGPNNAGKSLFLRELSGTRPRGRRFHRQRSGHYTDSRVIDSASWSTSLADRLHAEILSEHFGGDSQWRELPVQPWEQLIERLKHTIGRASEIRRQASALFIQIVQENDPNVAHKFSEASNFLESEDTSGIMTVLALATLLLEKDRRQTEKASTPGDATAQIHKSSIHESRDVAAEKELDHLEQHFYNYWHHCLLLLAELGVNIDNLALEGVLDLRRLIVYILSKMNAEHKFVIQMLGLNIEKLKELSTLSPDEMTLIERVLRLGNWFVQPSVLQNLLAELEELDRKYSWQASDMRQQVANQALYLDGLSRLKLTGPAGIGSYEAEESTEPILKLLKNPERMETLRGVVQEALGAYLVIDMSTDAPHVIWRLSREAPPHGVETSYTLLANEFHQNADLLDSRSDGIHAFVGMFAAILAEGTDLIFIDEPEAFLHPPLVRKFARQLTRLAKQFDWQVFIATHSSDLLAGCIAGAADVNIVRLTYQEERASARLLDAGQLRELTLDPLLRSESTLSALFHDGAIVCEAAADRVIYQEVNERLLLFGQNVGPGLESCIFLNAQNWQTVARMIQPLRKVGVAGAAILDADVLFGVELSQILRAAQIPNLIRKSILNHRGQLKQVLSRRASPGSDVKLKGECIRALSEDARESLEYLLDNLAKYGVFIVPVGELEDWFQPLGLTPSQKKRQWFLTALERLGVDPDSDGYVRPSNDDIWKFMAKVSRWILNLRRKGTAPLLPEELANSSSGETEV